jgi:hypothetical protein
MTATQKLMAAASAVLLTAGALAAAGNTEARRKFYLSAPGSSEQGWAGLRSSIQFLVEPAGGAACRVREVDEETVFKEGDRFKLRLQANVSGYLYVVSKNSSGDIRLLYPAADDARDAGRIKRFETRAVPAKGWFRFDENTGLDRVYLFVSPKTVQALERLAASPKRTMRDRDLDKLLDRADDHPRDQFNEGPDGAAAGATYYVEQLDWDRDYLVRRFRLTSEKR